MFSVIPKDRLISALSLVAGLFFCTFFFNGKLLIPVFLIIACFSGYELVSLGQSLFFLPAAIALAALVFYNSLLLSVGFIIFPVVFFPVALIQSLRAVITTVVTALTFFCLVKHVLLIITMGPWFYLSMQIIASTSDTAGFIFGKALPSRKLNIPSSPNKTLTGFMGSLIMTPIVYQAIQGLLPLIQMSPLQVFVLTIGSIWGDLIFSTIKRLYNIKDFSQIIPGHGGILDRVDSVIGASFFFLSIYFN